MSRSSHGRSRTCLAVIVVLAVVAGAGAYGFSLLAAPTDPSSAGPAGIEVVAAGAAVVVDVDPDRPFQIVVPDVAVIEGARGSVARPGRITAVPVESDGGGGMSATGLSASGRGVDVVVDDTELVQDLVVTFLDVTRAAADNGTARGVLHRGDDGSTDVRLANVTEGGEVRIRTREFSVNLPVDIDLRRWFADRLDGLADRLTGRTDPNRCADDGPEWSQLASTTDLVHICASSNPDAAGVQRAEARLQSNRRVWLAVATPPGAAYVWVRDLPDPARRVSASLAGSSADRYVLLPPESEMTAGFYQPAESFDYGFTVESQGLLRLLSLVSSVVGSFDLSGKGLVPTTLLLAGRCLDELPRSSSTLGDAGSMFQLLECLARQAGGELVEGDNAFAAALDLFGDNGYAKEASAGLARVKGSLQILGRFLALSGGLDLLRNAVNSVLDDAVSALTPQAGAVTVALSGPTVAPSRPAPEPASPSNAMLPPDPATPIVPAEPAPSRSAEPGEQPSPASGPGTSAATILVQNQVTNGPTQMVEDRTPSYLSSQARKYCKPSGCAVAGTDMGTGATLTASCVAQGETTTNGNTGTSADDANPGLWTSDLYYRATDPAGRSGYINEVWINPSNRGGMGLPTC